MDVATLKDTTLNVDNEESSSPIKILLVGSCDLRHVLKTASRLNRTSAKRPIHVGDL